MSFFSHHKILFLEIKAFSGKTAISKYVFVQKDTVPSWLKNYSEITIPKFCMEKGLQILIMHLFSKGRFQKANGLNISLQQKHIKLQH